MCECGHIFGKHEVCTGKEGKIIPCMNFTKDEGGLNISVCSCRNFKEA